MDALPNPPGDGHTALSSREYAVLAMVGLEGATAYELSLFSSSSKWGLLGYSRSALHAIPKRLDREGYLWSTVEKAEKSPSRRRYQLTETGVAAVRQWARSSPALPPVESELVARMLAWDTVRSDELLETLLRLRPEVERREAELKLADLNTNPVPHAELGRRLAIGLHRHLLDGYTRWLKDVERELRKMRRPKRGREA